MLFRSPIRRAAYDGAVATYRQTVLTAFQDVEDQLAAQSLLAQQLNAENQALASAQRTLDISNNRYKAGVEQYLDVITAQTTKLAHEQSVIQLTGQRLAASVSLIKSFGAGGKQPTTTTAARRAFECVIGRWRRLLSRWGEEATPTRCRV